MTHPRIVTSDTSKLDIEGIRARLLHAMEEHAYKAGQKPSANALSKAAGLSRAHVGMILRGDVKSQIQLETLRKVAAALHIRIDWLVRGDGPMYEVPSDEAALPEEQRAAIAWMRAVRYPAAVVERALEWRSDQRLSADAWIDLVRGWRVDFETRGFADGRVLSDEDVARPRGWPPRR